MVEKVTNNTVTSSPILPSKQTTVVSSGRKVSTQTQAPKISFEEALKQYEGLKPGLEKHKFLQIWGGRITDFKEDIIKAKESGSVVYLLFTALKIMYLANTSFFTMHKELQKEIANLKDEVDTIRAEMGPKKIIKALRDNERLAIEINKLKNPDVREMIDNLDKNKPNAKEELNAFARIYEKVRNTELTFKKEALKVLKEAVGDEQRAEKLYNLNDPIVNKHIKEMIAINNRITQLTKFRNEKLLNKAKNELKEVQEQVKDFNLDGIKPARKDPKETAAQLAILKMKMKNVKHNNKNNIKFLDEQLTIYKSSAEENFKEDMERRVTFVIHEGKQVMGPFPKQTLDKKRKFLQANKEINKLTKNEAWICALKTAVNQSSIRSAFSYHKAELNMAALKVKFGDNVMLTLEETEVDPPIQLEITRDNNGEIETVKVIIEGSLDLVTKYTSDEEIYEEVKGELYLKNAMTINFSYTIVMKNNEPVLDPASFKCINKFNI